MVDDGYEWLNVVADYHLDLFNNKRKTLSQAITTHHTLRRAGRHDEADHLTLDYIVGSVAMKGFYAALLNEWLPLVCNSQNLKTRADALGWTGRLLSDTGNYEIALTYLKQSLTISQQISDKVGESTSLNNMADAYRMQGNYETALTYLKQSLTISQQIGDKDGEGAALNNISTIYWAQSNYDAALIYMKQSLVFCQQTSNKEGEGTILNNISSIYWIQGDIKTALMYLKQALSISRQIGDKDSESMNLNNLSQLYHAQGDDDLSLIHI